MAAIVVPALVSTVGTALVGGGAAALTFGGVFGATTAFGMMASHFLVTTAIGAAINALTPKPSFASAQAAAGGYTTTVTRSNASHQIIYGRTKVGGVRVFDASNGGNNANLHRVLAFTGHEIQSFDEIYLNDELLTLNASGAVTSPSRYAGYVVIKKHLGSPNQLADTALIAENVGWTANHRLRGIAYLYVKLVYNQDVFPNGIPEITAVIKGKKVFDPRTSTTAWSDNPALCLRDYIRNTRYGLGEDQANLDEQKFITAANVCDYYNYPTLTGNQRFALNGSFLTDAAPYDLMQNMLSAMGGLGWYAQGKWRVKPAYWTEPVLTLDENDLRSSLSVATRHSRRDNFNKITGLWRGEDSNWQPTDFPPVINNDFLAEDNGKELSTDLNMPYTTDVGMVRRIANIYLERNRQQLTVMGSWGLEAFKVQVGDVVNLNHERFGWTNKTFEVASWTFGLAENLDLQVHMTLREITANVFDDVADGAIYSRDNTTLPSAFDVPALAVSVEAQAQVANQKVSNLALVTVSSGDGAFISRVEVEFKKSTDTNWKALGTGPVGIFEAIDLETTEYDFRARAINTFGVRGQWTTVTNELINAFIGPPSDVTNFVHEVSGGGLYLSWTAIPDPDLSHYVIKQNSATTGATWTNSTTVIEKIPRPATSVSLPARAGTFLIRAYDKEGNFSVNTSALVVQQTELPPLGFVTGLTEHPTFTGAKTNTVVVSNELRINSTAAAEPTGEYAFSDVIDLTSVRSARVTGFRTFSRFFTNGTILWDDIPQNWDTWPGLWDDWTDVDVGFGDVGVTIYVATTNDDPNGTPTWSPWQLANGSFYTARGFKFKAVLNSTNTNYTPSISELSVEVEY